jgi:hypothetical protein
MCFRKRRRLADPVITIFSLERSCVDRRVLPPDRCGIGGCYQTGTVAKRIAGASSNRIDGAPPGMLAYQLSSQSE